MALRYLVWREHRHEKKKKKRAHWLGGSNPEWMYPSRRAFKIKLWKWYIYLSLSVGKQDTQPL